MADWSQLPRELLDLISKHLISETDLLRFRSVCTSWRSSIQPFTSRFPILPNAGISDTTWGFYLSKRTIFRVGLPDRDSQQTPSPWLIKVERDNPQKTHLMNPLTGYEFIPLLPNFPRSLDLLNFRVMELGQEYALQYISYRPNANSIGDSVTLYMEKVAFCSSGVDGFVLLTIHVSGKLALLKYGERKWHIINDLPSPYDDVIFYKGEFYAVDSTGRTVIVVLDSDTTLLKVVANSVFGGDKKFLVESLGELFMVDKYLSVGPENDFDYDDENYEFYEDFDCFMSERTVKLEVYRLDREEQKWDEVKSLGDRMLFLGDNCGFSASASDFPGCRGNCVFFTGQSREDDGLMKSRGVGVFDLESGCIGPISNDSGYSQLFWPPPHWLHSDSVALEVRFPF
ncbi:F-box domain, cyclin-like protein [Cynara cardunculus var. scolymus]|uniref:F-box domain, cyclin-like protein n=1 Tax=Cynara cardunculus var. scolymus TaxID=59895 RepID=A0A103XC51_CYNCS|nr:F-box domain, cyclin-like protein [Cynara cardunculus var. scolymus]